MVLPFTFPVHALFTEPLTESLALTFVSAAVLLIITVVILETVLSIRDLSKTRLQGCNPANKRRKNNRGTEIPDTFLQKIVETIRRRKIRKILPSQIPLLLDAMASSLKAGYSIHQSLIFIASDLPKEISQECKKITTYMSVGLNLEESLQRLKNEWSMEEINFFADGTLIQMQKGGNIATFYQTLSKTIREKTQLETEMRNAVSQGRLSGYILAALWPASLCIFYMASPDYIDPLIHTTPGKFLLIASVILEIIGFFIIRKITSLPI